MSAAVNRPPALVVFPYEPRSSDCMTKVTQVYAEYSFYGLFDVEFLVSSACDLITSKSDADREATARKLEHFLVLAHGDCVATTPDEAKGLVGQACWLTVRMGQPTDDYMKPRWHRDGRMFNCSCPDPQIPHSKYAVTLLGTATKVLVSSPFVDRVERSNLSRDELATRLAGCEQASIQRGQAIRFSWGQDDSPIHSEPDSSGEDRVFVSVLFGSEEEIRNMCEWRDKEFGKVETQGE
jgi:hypothetical protein